jgi:hypothetical protein
MNKLEQEIASLLATHTGKTGEQITEVVAIPTVVGGVTTYAVKAKPSVFQDRAVALGDAWIQAFLRDQGHDAHKVRRVMIGAALNEPLRVWIEYLGSTEALDFPPLNSSFMAVDTLR